MIYSQLLTFFGGVIVNTYDFKSIEEKWQKKWLEEEPFKAIDFHPTKQSITSYMNFSILVEIFIWGI